MTVDKRGHIDSRLTSLTLDSKPYNSEHGTVNDRNGDTHATQERTLKTRLLSCQEQDVFALKDLLSTRITEGGGETLFELGVEDDGTSMKLTKADYEQCLQTILTVANELEVDCADINMTSRLDNMGYSGHLMFRTIPKSVEDILEIRVAVMGNVDAGKSTTIGVLTQDTLDDSRGKARMGLFRHLHERESGRTSSVGGEIIGFDSKSCMVPHPGNPGRKGWDEICSKASKIVSFVDLAGHEKYLKTTVFGITGNFPDFVMLLIAGNAGVIGMTKEHLGLALSLGIPLFIVITKIDRTPPNVLADTIKNLRTILKSTACQKLPLMVKTTDDVVNSVRHLANSRLCPIFQISNVTGEGLPLLRTYLNALPSVNQYNSDSVFHFEINDTFSVPFVGTVVSGCLKRGTIHVGDKVLYGPDYFGQFTTTTIKSIHRKRISVPTARAGQSVTFALKNVRRKMVRKGMILVAHDKDVPPPKVSRRFEAEIRILYHSTTIKKKYQAMVHCGSVRQTAQITNFEQKVLRTGDRATVQFEFIKHPEYLCEGAKLSIMSLPQRFISNSQFAVVGASTSRAKYGNKVLRWYQSKGLPVIPVHPKESEIEGIRTVSSVDQLEDPQHTSVSIITPPSVTLGVLKDCKRLGINNVWLQPGAEDSSVLACAQELGLNVIAGGPCILVQGPSLLLHRDTF